MAFYDRRDVSHAVIERNPLDGAYRKIFKRSLDILAVAMAAPVVALVVATLAIVIALDGKSPFYKQKRVGRNGREFNMLKLRSMIQDADAHLEKHLAENPDARLEWDTKQKLTNDPRITPVGRVIRKTSLDELPQLWNVLRGDMSLVGPRPMMPNQKGIYPGKAYYDMRPGITGLWQVSERNESSFSQRAYYDNLYHGDITLWNDLSLMFRTVGVVIAATGR
jgi:lipopolysaccharide/colanic/teichoic acid biosynthesis glycosyltransferase